MPRIKLDVLDLLRIAGPLIDLVEEAVAALRDGRISEAEAQRLGSKLLAVVGAVRS